MNSSEIINTLTELFSVEIVETVATNSWQIETENYRLLILLSDDNTWLRILIPIVPKSQGQPFLEQFLEANFDDTQEVRYALYQDVIWGVFQHSCQSLTIEDLREAIARLISLHQIGLDNVFRRFIENRIRQIIIAAKQQGQSLEATMQTLERFYAEGLMGEINQTATERDNTLAAWKYQLQSLWDNL
ncbi:hypothetical protein [Calothrix sp. 336/3]|uniref:hypothetical protein n=1 Tax=Calothrix sp. 336/3 TaxID=1337936 RepID=UPI0004E3277B|nr:hypothetical protein [Calothrix sp. 336/3]AKG21772.1 hypothetical protein IJ00_11345 [Calothrix sp. 336/3]